MGGNETMTKCPKCGSEKIYSNRELYTYGWYFKDLCLECGHVQLTPEQRERRYAVSYSKTNKPTILYDGHFVSSEIQVSRQPKNYEALEAIVELLNEKEAEIDRLKQKYTELEEMKQ